MATKKADTAGVVVGIRKIDVTLRGKPGSILVVHAFAEKAKEEIRAKQEAWRGRLGTAWPCGAWRGRLGAARRSLARLGAAGEARRGTAGRSSA